MTRVLSLPGYLGSSPSHWQSLWERLDTRIARVAQADWAAPQCEAWCARLGEALEESLAPTVLLGHSLGALLAVHAAARQRMDSVIGALLVAPPDLEHLRDLPALSSFAPVPRARLPFPAIVVASEDDPYCALGRARGFAEGWGARFVDAGALGHINADSGLGSWPMGRTLLAELCARAPFALDGRLAADTLPVGESALSLLLLMNDARYPWFILVPKRSAATEIVDLDDADQRALMHELSVLMSAVGSAFDADKVNVGALGNVVRQLHVHVLGRRLDDPAWPGPVWGHSPRVAYARGAERERVARLFRHSGLAALFTPAL